MASLTVTVGPVSGSVSADNGKASELLNLYIAARNGPVAGTNAEKLQFVAQSLVAYLRDVARNEHIRQELAAAEQTAINAVTGVDWT